MKLAQIFDIFLWAGWRLFCLDVAICTRRFLSRKLYYKIPNSNKTALFSSFRRHPWKSSKDFLHGSFLPVETSFSSFPHTPFIWSTPHPTLRWRYFCSTPPRQLWSGCGLLLLLTLVQEDGRPHRRLWAWHMVTVGVDGTVRVWNVDCHSLLNFLAHETYG